MRWFLLLVAALLAYASLHPWHFDFAAAPGNPFQVLLHGWPTEWDRYELRDLVLNIIAYTPLGFAAAFVFRRNRSGLFAIAAATAFGFAFSVCMELLQVYVPTRDSSLADVLTNTIGAAAGAAFAIHFEAGLRRVGEWRSSRFRPAAVLLLLVWIVVQLFPFFPDIGQTHLWTGLALLLHTREFPFVDTWLNCAEWFAVGLALDTVFAHMRNAWLAAAMLCVPAQLLISGRTMTVAEIAGALLAFGLWLVIGAESRPRGCAWMLGSAILLNQLRPFYFLAVPQPFSWIPFHATLESSRTAATVIIARKAFDYGALVWALRYSGVPVAIAALAVALMLGATEAIQTYLPGRSPEIADPLLALLMALALSVSIRSIRSRT